MSDPAAHSTMVAQPMPKETDVKPMEEECKKEEMSIEQGKVKEEKAAPKGEEAAKETCQDNAEDDKTVADPKKEGKSTEAPSKPDAAAKSVEKPVEKPAEKPVVADTDAIEPNDEDDEDDGELEEPEKPEEPLPTLPPPAADTPENQVLEDLGEPARTLFQLGSSLVKPGAGTTTLESLDKATEHFVRALRAIPDAKSTTAGYGELCLAYGKALLGFVVQKASESGVLGGDVEGALKKGKVSIEGEEGNLEEEESDEELCWTQLEVARVAFEKTGKKNRLAEVRMTIGDFLLICDQATAAGEEFRQAAEIYEGRAKAECLYKMFLALRKEKKDEAREALEKSLKIMADIPDVEDVVREMKDELEVVKAEMGGGEVKKVTVVKVMKVVPKRKRDKEEKKEEKVEVEVKRQKKE